MASSIACRCPPDWRPKTSNGKAQATVPGRAEQLRLRCGWLGSLVEHSLAILSAESGGLRRIDEVDERIDELFGSLDLGEMTNTLDDHQTAPRHGLVGGVGVAHRDDVV